MATQDNATAIIVAMIEKGLLEAPGPATAAEQAAVVAEAFRVVHAAVRSPSSPQQRG